MVQLCQLCCADPTLHSKLFRVVTYHRSNTTAASTSCEKKLDGMLSGGKVVVKASFFPHAHIQCMHLGSYFQGKRRKILKVRIFYIFKQDFFNYHAYFLERVFQKCLGENMYITKMLTTRILVAHIREKGYVPTFQFPTYPKTHACPYKQTVV